MKRLLFLAPAALALVLPAASAEEPHVTVTAVKDFVAAHKAKDTPRMLNFIGSFHFGPLAKSEKHKAFLSGLLAAAETEGATYSYEGDVQDGHVVIKPANVRVPVMRRGDPWSLNVEAIVGKVELTPEETSTYREIYGLLRVLKSYQASIGQFPTTEQGLKAIVEKPTVEPIPSRWFRFRRELSKDGWGNDFIYTATADGITIRSLGPDKKESADDLFNPF